MSARKFFTAEQKAQITACIVQAEKNTSGEIRVHIENRCKGSVLERAAAVFHSLKMDRTEQRNGVLFYLAVKDQAFAVLGDKGINDLVPAGFWDDVTAAMRTHFQQGRFTEGLCLGIQLSGEKLMTFFPYTAHDRNELSNDISFD